MDLLWSLIEDYSGLPCSAVSAFLARNISTRKLVNNTRSTIEIIPPLKMLEDVRLRCFPDVVTPKDTSRSPICLRVNFIDTTHPPAIFANQMV